MEPGHHPQQRNGPRTVLMEIVAGTQTNTLTFLGELGRDGMGIVYLAEDRGLGKRCAVKVLHEQLTRDEPARSRFCNEARATAAIDHAAVVKTYAIDELSDGRLCCRMEYVEGSTLSEFCRRKGEPLPVALILRIIGPICEAFDLLHALHIVHRDLNPDNVVIVERRGRAFPRVLNFSIVKQTDESRLTESERAPGTSAYMAPEQARGGAVDRSSDVYSLGVMIYWMATGGYLPHDVSDAVYSATPTDPRRRFSGISELAASVMLTAIHPDPSRRPKTMGAVALMLARCVTGDALDPDGTALLRECAPRLLIVGNLDETLRSPGVLAHRAPTAAVWKYEYRQKLGQGGMAEVVRATRRGEGQFAVPCALKLILPEFSAAPEFEHWFHQEARIAALLQHRNIVRVLDHDRDPMGRLYLAMEFIEGIDLEKLRLAGPMPVSVIIFVLCEVLEALDFAHDLPPTSPLASSEEIAARGGARGVVHRDVSHHNVLISWLADVKLSDFGIAKLRNTTAATGSRLVKGKPGYMSPEQITAREKIDGRSDLWAVGVMLWELLTGQTLFATGDNIIAIGFAICSDKIFRPSVVRPGVPPDLEAIALRLLERDLTRRFQSARDVIHALQASPFASRDGRAELARHLADRFPANARPVPESPWAAVSLGNARRADEASSPGRLAFAISSPNAAGACWSSTADYTQGQATRHPAPRIRRGPWYAATGIAIGICAVIGLAVAIDRSSKSAQATSALSNSERTKPASLQPSEVASPATKVPPATAVSPIVTATIATHPSGANVKVEGGNTLTQNGRSPVTIQVASGTHLHIQAELEGFKPEARDVIATENGQAIALTLVPMDIVPMTAKTIKHQTADERSKRPKAVRPRTPPNDDLGIIE